MKLKGASLLGTQNYFEEMKNQSLILKERTRPFLKRRVLVSQVGFGGYRIHDSVQEHHEALLIALQSGVNLVDTSANYTDGGSETLIGNVLGEVTRKFPRDHFVLVSKAGYVQGQNLIEAQSRQAQGNGYPEMVEYHSACWHCIHPDFLRDQLEASLKRLRVESLDVFLLHNPEYFFTDAHHRGQTDKAALRDRFYLRIEAAFEALEKLRHEGRIQAFGVSSNTLPLAADHFEKVDAERLVNVAEKVRQKLGLRESGFQVLQFPLNPLEHQAATLQSCSENRTLLEYCQEKELDVLINRPLNAFYENRLHRLAQKPWSEERNGEKEFLETLLDIARAEDDVWTYMEKHPSEMSSMVASNADMKLFRMGEELKGILDKIGDEEHWAEILHRFILGHTRASLQGLHKHFQNVPGLNLQEFSEHYLDSFARLEDALLQHLHKKEWLYCTSRLFEAFGPEFYQGAESPSAAVIRFLADLPASPVVLVGMRRKEYVEDGTSALIEERHGSVPAVLKRLREHFSHSEIPDPGHN